LKEEEGKERKRTAQLKKDMDPVLRKAKERDFGLERAVASQRIITLSEKHEKDLK